SNAVSRRNSHGRINSWSSFRRTSETRKSSMTSADSNLHMSTIIKCNSRRDSKYNSNGKTSSNVYSNTTSSTNFNINANANVISSADVNANSKENSSIALLLIRKNLLPGKG